MLFLTASTSPVCSMGPERMTTEVPLLVMVTPVAVLAVKVPLVTVICTVELMLSASESERALPSSGVNSSRLSSLVVWGAGTVLTGASPSAWRVRVTSLASSPPVSTAHPAERHPAKSATADKANATAFIEAPFDVTTFSPLSLGRRTRLKSAGPYTTADQKRN
jgi:hypothetical protein